MSIILLLMFFVIFIYLEISLLYFLVLLVFPFIYLIMYIRDEVIDIKQDRDFRRRMKEFNEYYHNKERKQWKEMY